MLAEIRGLGVELLGLDTPESKLISQELKENQDSVGIRDQLDEVGILKEHCMDGDLPLYLKLNSK